MTFYSKPSQFQRRICKQHQAVKHGGQSPAARVSEALLILNSLPVARAPPWQLVCGAFCLQFGPNYDVKRCANVANPFKAPLRVTFDSESNVKLV